MNQPNSNAIFFPAKHKKTSLMIVLAGITTSVITLFIVNYVSSFKNGIYLMGYYLDYVIPVGALGVGLVAGSGYGIASLLKGFKVNLFTLILILCLQITVYFMAKYIEFNQLNINMDSESLIDFFHYYDVQVRSFAFDRSIGGEKGTPLGLLGYAINTLEILGFTLGALTPLLILYFKPYCENCRVYMKTTILCFIPAGVIPKKIKSKDQAGNEAYILEQKTELEKGNKKLEEIKEFIALNDSSNLISEIERIAKEKKNALKLTKMIKLELIACKKCGCGYMQPSLIHDINEKLKVEKLSKIKIPIDLIKKLSSSLYTLKNK